LNLYVLVEFGPVYKRVSSFLKGTASTAAADSRRKCAGGLLSVIIPVPGEAVRRRRQGSWLFGDGAAEGDGCRSQKSRTGPRRKGHTL
jgi:hypothetical protein